jgi:hypothetical protein
MSVEMGEEIKRLTACRKSALVVENAPKARRGDNHEQYDRQLKELQEAYG